MLAISSKQPFDFCSEPKQTIMESKGLRTPSISASHDESFPSLNNSQSQHLPHQTTSILSHKTRTKSENLIKLNLLFAVSNRSRAASSNTPLRRYSKRGVINSKMLNKVTTLVSDKHTLQIRNRSMPVTPINSNNAMTPTNNDNNTIHDFRSFEIDSHSMQLMFKQFIEKYNSLLSEAKRATVKLVQISSQNVSLKRQSANQSILIEQLQTENVDLKAEVDRLMNDNRQNATMSDEEDLRFADFDMNTDIHINSHYDLRHDLTPDPPISIDVMDVDSASSNARIKDSETTEIPMKIQVPSNANSVRMLSRNSMAGIEANIVISRAHQFDLLSGSANYRKNRNNNSKLTPIAMCSDVSMSDLSASELSMGSMQRHESNPNRRTKKARHKHKRKDPRVRHLRSCSIENGITDQFADSCSAPNSPITPCSPLVEVDTPVDSPRPSIIAMHAHAQPSPRRQASLMKLSNMSKVTGYFRKKNKKKNTAALDDCDSEHK